MAHLKITAKMFQKLKGHLHPGDGLEAIAFAICGRLNNKKNTALLVHKVFLFPHDKCDRREKSVSWKTLEVEHLLEEAQKNGFAIVKFHSHPNNNSHFSGLDDISDKSFFETVFAWTEEDSPHGSVIVYPNGKMKGRLIQSDLSFKDIRKISIIGEDIIQYTNDESFESNEIFVRNEQAFGSKTVNLLKGLKIGVVGCSGTGSPTIEQLVRLGVGTLVIVDDDVVEEKNLNRIIGTTLTDAKNKRLKVEVLESHINKIGIGTKVYAHSNLIQESRATFNDLASCDLIFGCVDSAEGRHYLNLLSTYYLVPLIDIGVKLVADSKGGIESINGNVHYIHPGSETLLERNVYSSALLEAEGLKRISPEEYDKRQVYFTNAVVESPAVISVNTLFSSFGVNEMLSRFHSFRFNPNKMYTKSCFNLTDWDMNSSSAGETSSKVHSTNIGIGKLEPGIKI